MTTARPARAPRPARGSPQIRRAVALGGGHGLSVTLRALVQVAGDVTAVVGVADDGGSSGRIRDELGGLPPGDLRMALCALAGPDPVAQTWARVFATRFGGDGALAGHAVGNLVLAALTQVLADPEQALRHAGELLGARGRVLPVSEVPLRIIARVQPSAGGELVQLHGQAAIGSMLGRVDTMWLEPADPPVTPSVARLLAELDEGDLLVLGPGSWFSSVAPHLLMPGVSQALRSSRATRVLVLNLAAGPGETAGMDPAAHLHALARLDLGLQLDVVVVDRRHGSDADKSGAGKPSAAIPSAGNPAESALRAAARHLGASLLVADLATPGGSVHDPARLAQTLVASWEGHR